jgi:polygalacturonase
MPIMHNVRDFGAVGDGVTKDTAAIQRAIDAGGMVFFPPGEYLVGTLFLRSCGGLELAPGAVLRGSPDREDYDEGCCSQNHAFAADRVSAAHLLVACEIHHVVIRGGGRIDGNRPAFFEDREDPERPGKFQLRDWRPGQMLYFCESSDITIADVEFCESPYWCCFLHGCDRVDIRGVRIRNHWLTPNGDGIDLDCCRQVTVSDCIIDAGDDCITLRGCVDPLKTPRNCEHIAVSNCILSSPCCAIRVGVGMGVIRDCVFSGLVIHHTRSGIQVVSRFAPQSKGVTVENILFSDILMECRRPIAVLSDVHGARDADVKPIRGIVFRNIRGSADRSCFLEANRRGDITDITLESVDLTCRGGEDIVDGAGLPYAEHGVGNSPAAFHMKHIVDCTFDRVRVRWSTDASDKWRYSIWSEDSEAPKLTECRFEKEIRLD